VVFLQFTKTGPPITENFPAFFRLFLSAAVMAGKFYTPYDFNGPNLPILTARGMSHISYLNCPTSKQEKNYCALFRSPKSNITNQRNIDFNILGEKKRGKFHFIGTLRTFLLIVSAHP